MATSTGKIQYIKDPDTNGIVLPVTHERGVVDSSGVNLQTKLAQKIGSDDIDNVVELTQTQYDALQSKDSRTMYIISDSSVPSDHVGIASFEQTTTSTQDGGTNIWTVTLTNDQTFTLAVKNGNQGNSGYTGAAGELEVVNNVTSGGATKALSAEMGKQLESEVSQLGLELSEHINLGDWEIGSIQPGSTGIPDYASTTRLRMVVQKAIDKSGSYTITCESGYLFLIYVVGKITTASWTNKRTVSLVAGDIYRIALKTDPETNFSGYTQEQVDSLVASANVIMSGGFIVQDIAHKVEEINNKVNVSPGKNLYNKDTDISGFYFNTDSGTPASNSNYSISDYIEVTPGDSIHISGAGDTQVGSGYLIWYKPGRVYLSGVAMGKQYTVPAGAYFMRFSLSHTITEIQVEKGTTRTRYEGYTPIGNYIAPDENRIATLEDSTKGKVNAKSGKNLFNPDTVTSGKYINTSGGESDNSSYDITDYIAVSAGYYNLSAISSGSVVALGSNSACINLYDASKNRVSTITGDTQQISISSGVSFIRASYRNTYTQIQIESGQTRTEYQEYTPIGGYAVTVPDESVTLQKLSPAVQTMLSNGSAPKFNSCRTSGTLAPNGLLRTTERYHILKNTLLSARISGTIETVRVGVGVSGGADFRDYFAYWVEIDGVNVKLYWYNGENDVLLGTYTHGMTLSSYTTVEILTIQNGNTQTATLHIFDELGNIYTTTLNGWGVGTAFFQNGNTTYSLNVNLSYIPRDINKKIWLFGDSYTSFIAPERWPYYMAQQELLDHFVNSQPGLSPSSAYSDLQSLLTLGHIPTFLVWTLGMNGETTETQDGGGNYIINSSQKAVIDNVVTLCESYDITPVFGTVPTVPTRQKTGFCNYIRSLGYRYIDFADAVGATSAGVWNTGLLSGDGVHPSSAGAKVLASRVFVDFPEISVND